VEEVLVACPQERDRREVAAAGLDGRFRVRFAGPDLDAHSSWEAEAIVEELAALPVDGIAGTKDRSALVASLVAARRGLPGPVPAALVRCQHKPTTRENSSPPSSSRRSAGSRRATTTVTSRVGRTWSPWRAFTSRSA
jgi:hypothetical protein